MGLPVGDELAEAVGAPVGDGPQQVVIAGDADGDVVVLCGLGLGQPDPAVPLAAPVRGRRPQDVALSARCGSFQFGRTKWQV